MEQNISKEALHLWNLLVELETNRLRLRRELLTSHRSELVNVVRYGLEDKLWLAIELASALTTEELKTLFSALVCLASSGHGQIDKVRAIILSLPNNWVLENIESTAEPIINNGDDEAYRRFLELYWELDKGLALRLARRAASHPNEDIREAGEDFLKKLGSNE